MTPGSAAGSGGLLVLERVTRDPAVPSQVIGEVRVAGHPQRLVIDTGNPLGILEYVHVPLLLGSHDPSLHVVAQALGRWQTGEQLDLPLDLSDQIRDSDPPFPLRVLTQAEEDALDDAAARVDVRVISSDRGGTQPGTITASLLVDGVPMDVEAELPPDEPGVMRWVAGPPTAELGPVVLHAIQRALRASAE